MKFVSRRPERKDAPEYLKHFKVPPGERFSAIFAGPLIGVWTHWEGQSKPCLSLFTNGELDCNGCKIEKPVEWTGYLPIYRESGERGVVIVKEDQQAEIDTWGLHRKIIISRSREHKSPVRAKLDRAHEFSVNVPGVGPIAMDITPWLLSLWRVPALTEWVEAHPVTGTSVKPKPSTKPVVDPLADPEEKQRTAEALDQLRKRNKQLDTESKNGKTLNGKH